MAFWQTSSSSEPSYHAPETENTVRPEAQLNDARRALIRARRRLIGALILLIFALALIPLTLDKTSRVWGDDVILNMPKPTEPLPAADDKANIVNKPINTGEPKPLEVTK